MANPKQDNSYLAKKFFEIDNELLSLGADRDGANASVGVASSNAQKALGQLVRAAVVVTAIPASSGFPSISSGTIQLVDFFDATVLQPAVIPGFSYNTTGHLAAALVFVVLINDSYFVIK